MKLMKRYFLLLSVAVLAGCGGAGAPMARSQFQGTWEGSAVEIFRPDHTAFHLAITVDADGNGTCEYQGLQNAFAVANNGTVSGNVSGTLLKNTNNTLAVDISFSGRHLTGELNRSPR